MHVYLDKIVPINMDRMVILNDCHMVRTLVLRVTYMKLNFEQYHNKCFVFLDVSIAAFWSLC